MKAKLLAEWVMQSRRLTEVPEAAAQTAGGRKPVRCRRSGPSEFLLARGARGVLHNLPSQAWCRFIGPYSAPRLQLGNVPTTLIQPIGFIVNELVTNARKARRRKDQRRLPEMAPCINSLCVTKAKDSPPDSIQRQASKDSG
jgi:hypothetical protein